MTVLTGSGEYHLRQTYLPTLPGTINGERFGAGEFIEQRNGKKRQLHFNEDQIRIWITRCDPI